MRRDPIREVMTSLAQQIKAARPWWDVRNPAAPNGPPGAGLIEIRAQLRDSGSYRRLRIWFRLDTPPDHAIALLDKLLLDPNVASAVDLYAWEWRHEEAPEAPPYRPSTPPSARD